MSARSARPDSAHCEQRCLALIAHVYASTHTHTHERGMHTQPLSQSVSFPLIASLFSPSPLCLTHTHTHTHRDAGCHYSVVIEHSGNSSGTKRLSLHSRCVLLLPPRGRQDWRLSALSTPTAAEESAHVRVHACASAYPTSSSSLPFIWV